MGETEFFLEPGQRQRLFHGVEVFALNVLDQRHGDGGFVRHLPDHRRDGVQLGHLRRPPAALAGDDFVAVIAQRAHHDGLHDALRADRLRQLLERIGGHVLARLVAAALHQLHRQVAQIAVAGRALGLLLRRLAVTLDAHFFGLALVRLVAAEQGVETLAETAFTLCRHSRCLYLMPGIAEFAERPWHFAWPVRAAGFRPPAPDS